MSSRSSKRRIIVTSGWTNCRRSPHRIVPGPAIRRAKMTKSATTLDDKYRQLAGRVFLSSNQALTRLPLDQARRDRAAGLKTAGYISGYRGSPLGVYDSSLWAAQTLLDEHGIRFVPGLNEELAVSAIRGTQELDWFGKSDFEGVFGLW